MKSVLGWEPSKGARYAEKWWKRNGYEYERVSCGVDDDTYMVGKPDGIKVQYTIESRNPDFAGAMNKFREMYEIKTHVSRLQENKSSGMPRKKETDKSEEE